MRLWLGLACVLCLLAACGGSGTAVPAGPGIPAGQASEGPRLLTALEAVDLARYRGWHYPQVGVISGVPNAREVFVSRLTWKDARALLKEVDPAGLKRFEAAPKARRNGPPPPAQSAQVFIVVVRGPVLSDQGKIVADSLAMVVDRHARVIYLAAGKPWDGVTPPHAEAISPAIAHKVQDVSLARAQNEIGGVPLVEPGKLPEGFALAQVNINQSGSPVDPTETSFDYTNVTLIYGDREHQARLWISQAVFLHQPRVSGQATSVAIGKAHGKRYVMQKEGRRLIAFAWESGDRSLYLVGEVSPDLTEEALVGTATSIVVDGQRPPLPSAASS
jgi:hypothetical protein